MKIKQNTIENILNNYSKKFGLDLNYFASGGFWLILGQISNILKFFVLTLIFTNLFSKEIYGQYIFITTILAIVSVTALPGLSDAIINSISKKYDGNYFIGLKLVFKWSFLGSIALILVSIYTFYTNHLYVTKIFIFLSILFPLYSISGFYGNILSGKQKFKELIQINILFNFVYIIIVLYSYYFFKENLFALIILTILFQCIFLSYISLIYVKKFIVNKNKDYKSLKFGLKTSFSSGLSIIALKIDSLVVGYFLGFEELAIFTLITLIPNQLKLLPNTFTPLILPRIASKKFNLEDIFNIFKKLVIISILLIIFYTLFAPLLFKIFYADYFEYVWLSIFFNLSLITFPSIILSSYFIKQNEIKKINTINNILFIYITIGSIFFTIYFGLIGAIINRMISRFLGLTLMLYFFKKSKNS